MAGLRLLNDGTWNKPPVLTAARRILVRGLSGPYPQCTLGDAASFVNGTSYDVAQVSESGASPIIRISNITDPSSPCLRTSEQLGGRFWVRAGDLLVSWSASFKSIIWPGPEGYLNQHIFKVTEREGFDRRYVRHAIEASFDEMQEKVVGIGMMHLRRADFLGQRIPAPPRAVQQAVANCLDAVESGAEGERPELPPVLAEQRRLVARIEAVTGDISEARRLRQESARVAATAMASVLAARLGGLPAAGRLEDVVLVKPRSGPAFATSPDWPGTPVLMPSCVTGFGVDVARVEYGAGHERISVRDRLVPGDILIARGNKRAQVGNAGVVPAEATGFVCANLLMRMRLAAETVDPSFCIYWLRSPGIRRYIDTYMSGTNPNIQKINQRTLLAMPFPTAIALPEQRRIVAELDALQAEVDRLRALQAETAVELDALLPALLDRAFRGDL